MINPREQVFISESQPHPSLGPGGQASYTTELSLHSSPPGKLEKSPHLGLMFHQL